MTKSHWKLTVLSQLFIARSARFSSLSRQSIVILNIGRCKKTILITQRSLTENGQHALEENSRLLNDGITQVLNQEVMQLRDRSLKTLKVLPAPCWMEKRDQFPRTYYSVWNFQPSEFHSSFIRWEHSLELSLGVVVLIFGQASRKLNLSHE